MPSFGVVEREIPIQAAPGLGSVGVVPQVDLLVLHAPPQPLHEDVVQRPAALVHVDPDPRALQPPRELVAHQLRPLVRVEDLGLADPQRLVHCLHAEQRVQRVGQRPRQHVAAEPVQHRDQIQEPAPPWHLRDVRAPHLVGPDHRELVQQIRVRPMRRLRPARVRARQHRLQAHDPYQARHPLVVDRVPQGPQPVGHPRHPVKRPIEIQFVEQAHQRQILGPFGHRLVGVRRAGQARQRILLHDRHGRGLGVNPSASGLPGHAQSFF